MTTPTIAGKAVPNTKTANTNEVQEKWQTYKSARPSVRLITTGGKKISFVSFAFMTQDKDIIAYLDAEIANGLQGITRGEAITTEERDPMYKLRKELEVEMKDKLRQEILDEMDGKSKDMGTTESAPKVKIASSKTVAN